MLEKRLPYNSNLQISINLSFLPSPGCGNLASALTREIPRATTQHRSEFDFASQEAIFFHFARPASLQRAGLTPCLLHG
jgi:hypothetical protein